MSNVKERIIGAVTIMDEQDAIKVWDIITTTFRKKEWSNIPEELPDDIDLAMLEEMKADPDCHEFISSDETMKLLGL